MLIYNRNGKEIKPFNLEKAPHAKRGEIIDLEEIICGTSTSWAYALVDGKYFTPDTHELVFVGYSTPEGMKQKYWNLLTNNQKIK